MSALSAVSAADILVTAYSVFELERAKNGNTRKKAQCYTDIGQDLESLKDKECLLQVMHGRCSIAFSYLVMQGAETPSLGD